MGAKLGGSGDDDIIADINVTPMVDIMLVLLIIFMLTSETVAEKVKKPAIEVDLPQAASSQDKLGTPLSVVINKDGDLFINGDPASKEDLRQAVRRRVIAAGSGKVEAVLSADRRVIHGSVVRIIDMIRLLGIENVAINTKEQEIE